MTVWLHTDESAEGGEEGFLLHWNTSCQNTIYHAMVGTIQSHNYPAKYLPNTYCYWIVKFLPGLDVNVKFTDFMIQKCGKGV